MEVIINEIWQVDAETLGINWQGKGEKHYKMRTLRERCPCALCLKDTPQKTSTYQPKNIQSIGRYGLSITFADGHSSGIYKLEDLQQGRYS